MRTGLQSITRGQWEAAYALGLTRGQALRLVIIPRDVPRDNPADEQPIREHRQESTLVIAIGYADFMVCTAGTMINRTSKAIEGTVIIILVYLAINLDHFMGDEPDQSFVREGLTMSASAMSSGGRSAGLRRSLSGSPINFTSTIALSCCWPRPCHLSRDGPSSMRPFFPAIPWKPARRQRVRAGASLSPKTARSCSASIPMTSAGAPSSSACFYLVCSFIRCGHRHGGRRLRHGGWWRLPSAGSCLEEVYVRPRRGNLGQMGGAAGNPDPHGCCNRSGLPQRGLARLGEAIGSPGSAAGNDVHRNDARVAATQHLHCLYYAAAIGTRGVLAGQILARLDRTRLFASAYMAEVVFVAGFRRFPLATYEAADALGLSHW